MLTPQEIKDHYRTPLTHLTLESVARTAVLTTDLGLSPLAAALAAAGEAVVAGGGD